MLVQLPFHLTFDVDESSLSPRSFHGHLQTPNARALHQRRERELAGGSLAGRSSLFAKRAACGCPHLHEGYGGCAGRRDRCESVRHATGPHACGVAPTGGYGMPERRNGNSGEERRSAWSSRNLGSRDSQRAVFRAVQRPLGMTRVIPRIRAAARSMTCLFCPMSELLLSPPRLNLTIRITTTNM